MEDAKRYLRALLSEYAALTGGLIFIICKHILDYAKANSPWFSDLMGTFPPSVFYLISLLLFFTANYFVYIKITDENAVLKKTNKALQSAKQSDEEPSLRISHGDGGRFLDSIEPRSIDGFTHPHRLSVAVLGKKELKKCNLRIISVNGLPESRQCLLKKDSDTWENFVGNYDIYPSEPLYFDFITTHTTQNKRPFWRPRIIVSPRSVDYSYLHI